MDKIVNCDSLLQYLQLIQDVELKNMVNTRNTLFIGLDNHQ